MLVIYEDVFVCVLIYFFLSFYLWWYKYIIKFYFYFFQTKDINNLGIIFCLFFWFIRVCVIFTIIILSQGVVDPKVEVARLTKKLLRLENDERKVVQRVTTPGYAEKSPPHVQEAHHAKVSITTTTICLSFYTSSFLSPHMNRLTSTHSFHLRTSNAWTLFFYTMHTTVLCCTFHKDRTKWTVKMNSFLRNFLHEFLLTDQQTQFINLKMNYIIVLWHYSWSIGGY